MATTGASGGELGIRALLALIIIALVGVLLYVTVVPAQRAAAAERETEMARERMSDVRTALIVYRDSMQAYPSTLDSLVLFSRGDGAFLTEAMAQEGRVAPPVVDSLPFSSRDGQRFRYQVVEDTTGYSIYWLADPSMESDSIGSRDPNPALRNAASWE